MKRYLVFALFVLASLQVIGQSSCKINHFYQEGTTTDITEVAYNAAFDMELLVVYNPQDQATDKLKIIVQLPVGDNANVLAGINAFPIIISSQNLNYATNILEIEITGFSATQQSTFTINLYKARISAVASCAPVANFCTTTLQYYDATNGSFLDFPNNVFSATIYGKHLIGTISTQLINNQSYYSPTNDAKSPIYVDLQVNTSGNTYVNSAILVRFNSSLSIKKVITNYSTEAPLITVGSVQYYSLPAYYSIVRIYFDLPESNNTAVLSLTGEAVFASCPSQSAPFPINPVNISFNGKPDNDILAYPSIFQGFNYSSQNLSFDACNEYLGVSCYLDNIYNAPITVQQPIVMIVDIAGKIEASSLWFSGIGQPDKVYIKICGNTSYETTPLTFVGDAYVIPSNIMVEKIRIEFLYIPAEISTLNLNCKNVSSTQCGSGSAPAITFRLLKNESDYLIENVELVPVTSQNSVSLNYDQNFFSAKQEVRPNNLFLGVFNTLQNGDYLSYSLSDNMTFPENPDLQFTFNNPYSFQSVGAFNAQYFSNNPITYEISPDRKTLLIKNLSLKGRYSDCELNNYALYIRVTTKVIDKPSSIENVNIFSLKNSAGSTLASTQFNWSVIVTQAVTNTVFFSCDGGATRTAGITIKQGDALNVYYTLENTTLYKYDQKTFTFYCTLPTVGLEPALLVSKTAGTISAVVAPSLYDVSYATGNLDDYGSLTYSGSSAGATILQVQISDMTVDAYEKLILSLAYATTPGLTSNNSVRFYAKIQTLTIPPQSSALIVGPKSDCDLFDCVECITSFSPTAGEEYIISAWVKESFTDNPPTTYSKSGVRITFNDGAINTFPLFRPTGPIVDGWQRIEASFIVPTGANNIHITLVNESPNTDVFFDDIRIHPYNSNMKSFVYNPSTQKLVAELDENNFATMYEYDDEGILIRVKKETERGVMTIKETRSNQSKIQSGQ